MASILYLHSNPLLRGAMCSPSHGQGHHVNMSVMHLLYFGVRKYIVSEKKEERSFG